MIVSSRYDCFTVMPGLVTGIHALGQRKERDVDGRDKPGHDDCADKRHPTTSAACWLWPSLMPRAFIQS
jgi:hypothetical protein